MTHLKIEEAVNQLDPIDVRDLLKASDIQLTIMGGLDGSPPEEVENVELTFDIDKFRNQLRTLLTR